MFRYAARKYNESLIAMGCIRVGTLHDFRQHEHKRGVSDPDEGKKTVSHYIGEYHSDPLKHARALESLANMTLGRLIGISWDDSKGSRVAGLLRALHVQGQIKVDDGAI